MDFSAINPIIGLITFLGLIVYNFAIVKSTTVSKDEFNKEVNRLENKINEQNNKSLHEHSRIDLLASKDQLHSLENRINDLIASANKDHQNFVTKAEFSIHQERTDEKFDKILQKLDDLRDDIFEKEPKDKQQQPSKGQRR